MGLGKKILIGVGGLVVLLIVAAVVAPFLIPLDTYKGQLIALVKESTGRELKIDGAIKLSILPQLEIGAADVAFANAPGAADPEMMRLKALRLQLRLLPLLHGAVEIAQFVLTEPVIALEIDKTGRPNWVFATAPASAASKPGAAAARGGPGAIPLADLALGDVRLDAGKISYRDDRAGTVQEIDDINMKLSLPDLASPFSADGSAVWNGEKVALTVAVAKPGALVQGAQSGADVKVTSTPVTFDFAGTVTGLPPAKVDGTIDLAVPSVRDLAKWAGSALPPGGGLGKLAVKGKVQMTGTSKIAFSDAEIALDAINAKGALAVDTSGARPALTGALQVDKLDLNPYLPAEKAAPGAAAPAAGGAAGNGKQDAGWSDAPIDDSSLGVADADLTLAAGAILYRKIEIGKSALDVHLKDKKLTANLSEIALYQGNGKGTVTLDGSAATPATTMSFNLAGVQIEPLLKAAADHDWVSGSGNVTIDVAGSGKSQRALIGALNGKGSFNIANGTLKGVNLIAMAEGAVKSAVSSLTGASGGGNSTDFTLMNGTFTITNGIVHNDDFQLKSGLVPVTGAGTVDLPKQTVDYRVTVSPAGAVGVPILVSGPWSDISYRPDVAGMLQNAAKQPGKMLDTLKGLAPGTGGGSSGGASGPGTLLKGLFGK